jgi:hypothetical protein
MILVTLRNKENYFLVDQVHAGGVRHAGHVLLLCHYHHDHLGDARSRQEVARTLRIAAQGVKRQFLAASGRQSRIVDGYVDFTLPTGAARHGATSNRRVFAQLLSENDVLLSTLVTSPRVTFAGTNPGTAVYPTDHWYRLRFRETPGAWALVLATPAIRAQLERLAIGTVQ